MVLPARGLHATGVGVTPARRWIAALALAALAAARPAAAEWTTVADEGQPPQAQVRNDEGAEVRIRLVDGRVVHATYRLPAGLARLDPAGCPTFQIDKRVPENLATGAHACRVTGDGSEVVLADVVDGRVESPTLLELMNGGVLTVRYRLLRGGYGSSRFTLRHSKQALNDALGDGIIVAGD